MAALYRMRSAWARVAHRRALGAVENAELDAASSVAMRHGAAERVHLFHQVALADAANAGVAAHLAPAFRCCA